MKKRRMLSVIAISALVSLGMCGTLTACGGEDTPIPEVTKYKVTVNTSADFTVAGLVADGYQEGETVEFTINVTNAEKEIDSVKNGSTTLTPTNGKYSFKMGNSDAVITVTLKDIPPADASLTLDVEELVLDELGVSKKITATLTNSTEAIVWTSTDEAGQVIQLTPSEDGLSCDVTNIGGGSTVLVTATAGELSQDVIVKASLFGDQRATYTVYKKDGTKVDDYKGLWNAVGKLQALPAADGVDGYITAKDSEEKIYDRSASWLKALGKTGQTQAQKDWQPKAANHTWDENRTKASGWYANYQLDVDVNKDFNVLFTQEQEDTHWRFNAFESRAVNFDKSLFLDGNHGYNGDPTSNIWCGWRDSYYLASVTTAQYISWADSSTWKTLDMTWDLSKSVMVPSYNNEQSVFGQLYLGTGYRIPHVTGMIFDAGTMEENKDLPDGTEKDIFTFTEFIKDEDNGFHTGTFGERTIGTTSIGKAKWDAFQKAWTFPNVKVNIKCDVFFTGEDPENPEAKYHRDYTITGLKGDEEVATVTSSVECTSAEAAAHTRAGSNERMIYGCSFTPNYKEHQVPDITCGGAWKNVIQDESLVFHVDPEAAPINLQFVAGRGINHGNQTGLIGCDSLTLRADAEERSIFDFKY